MNDLERIKADVERAYAYLRTQTKDRDRVDAMIHLTYALCDIDALIAKQRTGDMAQTVDMPDGLKYAIDKK